MRFVAYTPDGGIELFDTREEAIARVNSYLSDERQRAQHVGEWDDYVTHAWWGQVVEKVVEVDRQPTRCPDCEAEYGMPHSKDCDDYDPEHPERPYRSDVDYTCDHQLRPVEEAP